MDLVMSLEIWLRSLSFLQLLLVAIIWNSFIVYVGFALTDWLDRRKEKKGKVI